MPLFSIIIPTYNRAHMLPSAIVSVIGQTETDWELIIVDDGSKDDTKEIVSPFVQKDKRIQYIYQDNAERSAARNNGIEHANGEWICFLDSDDVYYQNHLSTFKTLIEKNEQHPGLYFSGISFEKYDHSTQTYFEEITNDVEFVLMNTFATSRACVAKEILLENKFIPAIRIGEDTELWTRIAAKHPVFYHQEKTYIQKEHPLRSVNQDSKFEHLKTLLYIFKNLQYRISLQTKNRSLSDAYFNISKDFLLGNFMLSGMYYLIRSVVKNLRHPQTKYKINILLNSLLFRKKKVRELLSDTL